MKKISTLNFVTHFYSFEQLLAATAKNFIIFNLGEFTAFSAIVIPSLIGLANDLNPDETVRIDGEQTSWLGECSFFILLLVQKNHFV